MPVFLHTADLHLNSLKRFQGYLVRSEKILEEISRAAVRFKVDFIVVAGDVYHSQAITHLERKLFSDWLGSVPVPVVVISGNHEVRSGEIGDTCLSYLSGLQKSLARHLIYDGPPTVVNRFGCNLILLPYQGWKHSEFILLAETLVRYAAATTSDDPIIVVMHEHVYGAKTDRGHKFPENWQIHLYEDWLMEVSYWALGDIHSCQSMIPNAWYSGPPFQTRFDEELPKGVLIVDTENPTEPRFEYLESIPLLQVDEFPDPVPMNAYLQLKPSSPLSRHLELPPNMELHPQAHLFKRPTEPAMPLYGLFDGLGDFLVRAGLDKRLRKKARRLVRKIGMDLDISITL